MLLLGAAPAVFCVLLARGATVKFSSSSSRSCALPDQDRLSEDSLEGGGRECVDMVCRDGVRGSESNTAASSSYSFPPRPPPARQILSRVSTEFADASCDARPSRRVLCASACVCLRRLGVLRCSPPACAMIGLRSMTSKCDTFGPLEIF